MDFIEGLLKVAGNEAIYVVVDRLSKAAHFLDLKHPYTALDVAQLFMVGIFKLHRMPKSIVPDKDPIFLPLAEWWYKTSYHSSIHMTPYEVVYGRKPPPLLPYLPFDSQLDMVDRSLQAREATIRSLKFHMGHAQNRMKVQADKHMTK
ncbi:uncharacterized protein LOC142173357 [Nicotiana tabacum]|uniref:Uncharacterized protein LOC142173357 n=1 Tax=Nicotiana tabacum TaxID=4097 RepID=A0AC58TCT7_TOBAC